jgi:hypothetical protein
MVIAVRSGIDLKEPVSTAFVQVAVVQLKHTAWRNLMALVLICGV